MHSTRIEYEGSEFILQHNGDYSGDVWFKVPEGFKAGTYGESTAIMVPNTVLLEFVGYQLGDKLIGAIEELEGVELIKALMG